MLFRSARPSTEYDTQPDGSDALTRQIADSVSIGQAYRWAIRRLQNIQVWSTLSASCVLIVASIRDIVVKKPQT